MSNTVFAGMNHRCKSALALCAIVASAAIVAATGASAATFPGTNGKIAFSRAPATGTSADIFTIDPSGANRLQLTTDPANDNDPSWSGDGERIAFWRFTAPNGAGSIWVMNHDGTGQQQLTPGTANADDCCPSFSPAGKTIAFERFDGNFVHITRINTDGTGATPLTAGNQDDLDAQYSPDGTKIAFTRQDPATGSSQIWIMNSDGSGQQVVYAPPAPNDFVASPAFSPNGQQLLYFQIVSGHLDIGVVNVNGSNPTLLTNTPEDEDGPKFSPDGTKITFSRAPAAGGSESIIVADPNGSNQQVLADAGSINFGPDWQPLNPPSCDISGEKKSKPSGVNVTVTCANEDATATISGAGKVPKAASGAAVSKKKKLQIPPVTVEIPQGTPTNVTLKIPKKGKKLLKKALKSGKKGKATISASLTSDLGESSSDTFKATFKPKKK